MAISGFRYGRISRPKRANIYGEVSQPNDDEGLTGFVQGKPASDLEERIARALYKRRKRFEFQVEVFTRLSRPDDGRNVDFIVDGVQPVEPDGFIGHYRTISQKGNDYVRELQLNEAFRKMGLRPLIRVPYFKLQTQEMTDRWVRRNL